MRGAAEPAPIRSEVGVRAGGASCRLPAPPAAGVVAPWLELSSAARCRSPSPGGVGGIFSPKIGGGVGGNAPAVKRPLNASARAVGGAGLPLCVRQGGEEGGKIKKNKKK